MKLSSFALLLASVVGLESCMATNPATGGSMFSMVSAEQERKLGEETAMDAIKTIGLYKAQPRLENYYKQLGKHIWSKTEMAAAPIEFILLDDGEVNAWATPGFINTYRGLFPYLNSEAELAAVLAHEAGHINARHIARGVTSNQLGSLAVNLGAIAVGAYTGSADAARAAGQLGGLGAQVALSGYGRDYEREADSLAVRYMPKAGYDAREAYNVFHSFDRMRDYAALEYGMLHNGKALPKSPFYSLLSSHPEPLERQQNVIAAVGKPDGTVRLPQGMAPATPVNDPQGRSRFFDHIDGMAWGPKADQGVASRTKFYDPYDKFVWKLPEGLHMVFQGGHWEGVRATDGLRVFLTAIHGGEKDPEYDSEEVLRLAFPSVRGVERASVGGRTGYTGTLSISGGFMGNADVRGTARAIAFPSGKAKADDYRTKHHIIMVFVTPNAGGDFDKNVKTAIDSIRYLSATESKNVQQLRVDVVTVKAGDTLNSLANRMAQSALRRELFMGLNALEEGTPLIPGMQVKLITDPNTL
ncbi:MAG: M48 family metalloprotease [Alphaproteobacteria bacterium]